MALHSLPGSLENVGAPEMQPLNPQKYDETSTFPLEMLRKKVTFTDQKLSCYFYLFGVCTVAYIALTAVTVLQYNGSNQWFMICLATGFISIYFAIVFAIKWLLGKHLLKIYQDEIKTIAPPEQDQLIVQTLWGNVRHPMSPIQTMIAENLNINLLDHQQPSSENQPLFDEVAPENIEAPQVSPRY